MPREREREQEYPVSRGSFSYMYLVVVGLLVFLALLIFVPCFVWFGCRIEVGPGEFVPLLQKTGRDLSNDLVLAPSADFKGVQLEILKEGRHFRNPYQWDWPGTPMKATIVDRGKVGVLVRRFGKPLVPGGVLALQTDQKGIIPDPLLPGRHYINLWAFNVIPCEMVRIEPGNMGVVSLLVGKDPTDPFAYVVKKGERGTQPYLLPPGTHPEYSNPYVHRVTSIDVRSHKLDVTGEYNIHFPSRDGFDIKVEGMIEWAPDLQKLPELFMKYVDDEDLEKSGGINNIQQEVILPFARSFFRTIGGSHRAVDYITGRTRTGVQNEVQKQLSEACAAQGILIRSVVIKATKPPEVVSKQYERREIARRTKDRYMKEIETEIGSAELIGLQTKLDEKGQKVLDEDGAPILIWGKPTLTAADDARLEGGRIKRVIQQRKRDREQRLGTIREEIVGSVRDAEQYRAVHVTQGQKDLSVAQIALEAAKDLADAVRAKGKVEAEVAVLNYRAEAQGVQAKVEAFGGGNAYAEFTLIQKFSPGIREIFSNTEGLFAKLFERFVSSQTAPESGTHAPGKEGKP